MTDREVIRKHTYPSKYAPGSGWAIDAAWEILDRVQPGVIDDLVRAFLAGLIAGRLMKVAEDPPTREE